MAASPSPMSRWTPTMAARTVAGGTGACPPSAKSTEKTAAAAGTETKAPTAAAAPTDPRRRGSRARTARATAYPEPDPDEAHQQDVRAQGSHPAVGEEQALDEEDDGEAQGGGPWADEDGCERAAQQVTGGPRADGEVDHLGREDEDGDQTDERCGAVLELATRPAQGDGHPDRATTPVAALNAGVRKPSGTCTGGLLVSGGRVRWGGRHTDGRPVPLLQVTGNKGR